MVAGGNNESDIVFAFQMSAVRRANVIENSRFLSCQSTVMTLREEKTTSAIKVKSTQHQLFIHVL